MFAVCNKCVMKLQTECKAERVHSGFEHLVNAWVASVNGFRDSASGITIGVKACRIKTITRGHAALLAREVPFL